MTHAQDAAREAYRLVPETCPAVDYAAQSDDVSAVVRAAKDATRELREALVSALERALAIEARLGEVRYLCKALKESADVWAAIEPGTDRDAESDAAAEMYEAADAVISAAKEVV